MGSKLWIRHDVGDWLTDLRNGDPDLARVAGEAVLALLEAGDVLGPPLLVVLPYELATDSGQIRAASKPPGTPPGNLQRHIADVSTARKWVELQVNQLERRAAQDPSFREQFAKLRLELLRLSAEEEALIAESERPEAGAEQSEAQLVKAVVLRLGAPDRMSGGLLFALPAPDMAVLIAHVTDVGASLDDYLMVVLQRLQADGLSRTQAGFAAGVPTCTAFTRYDATSFLSTFFAGQETAIGIGAGGLLARHRVHTLAETRQRMELTQSQVARRMDVRQERVSAIERAEPGAVEVRTLAAYVAALGGKLEITAHIDDERITLFNHA